jgi:hypothetical protein
MTVIFFAMAPPISANKTGLCAFILAKSRRETLKGRRVN